jgi:archaellin
LSDPSAAAASGVDWTSSTITADSSADATGTASFFRCLDSNANVVLQGTVGTSGADLNLNSVSITSGDNVAVTSFVITEGNA